MAELLNTLHQLRRPLSLIHPSLVSEDLLDYITHVSHRLSHFRNSFQVTIVHDEESEFQAWGANILDVLREVEEIGILGWIRWMDAVEREGWYERAHERDIAVQEMDVGVGENELIGERAAGLQNLQARCESADKDGEEKPKVTHVEETLTNEKQEEEDDDNRVQELRQRTESLQARLGAGHGFSEIEADASGLRGLPSIYEEDYGNRGSLNTERGSTHTTVSSSPRSGFQSIDAQRYGESDTCSDKDFISDPEHSRGKKSMIAEAGSSTSHHHARPNLSSLTLSNIRDTEYPPQLTVSTISCIQINDQDVGDFEDNALLWGQKQKDRTQDLESDYWPLFQDLESKHTQHHREPPKCWSFKLDPPFTIPSHDKHSCTITFHTPALALHFPGGATRDQLLETLEWMKEKDSRVPEVREGETLNVIRIRTQSMEWELKNAIIRYFQGLGISRQSMAENWPGEGKGDTYIVSVPNIHFHGIYKENSKEDTEEVVEDGWHERPYLRGGAGTEESDPRKKYPVTPPQDESGPYCSFPNPVQKNVSVPYTSVETPRTLEDMRTEYLATHFPTPAHKNNLSWMQEAHALECKVNSLQYEYESLQYAYMEAQCNNRERLSRERNPYQLYKCAVMMMRSLAIGHNLTFEEVYQALKNEDEQNELQKPVFWDARQEDIVETGGPTPCTNLEQNDRRAHEEPSTHDVSATCFYFFPTVSTVVLLTSPKIYFQWPGHTTLRQLRQILLERKEAGIENDPNCVRIREILEIRDAMGIPDPDMSDGRMVLINLPEALNDFEDVNLCNLKWGMKNADTPFWEKKMWDETGEHPNWHGTYQEVEQRIRRKEMRNADRSHLSPTNNEGGYFDIGNLIYDLDAHTDDKSSVSVGSSDNEPYVRRAPAQDQNNEPYALRTTSLHSGASGADLPFPQTESSLLPQSLKLLDLKNEEAWGLLYPPRHGPGSQLDRNANFDYAQPPDGTRAAPCSPVDGQIFELQRGAEAQTKLRSTKYSVEDECHNGKGEGCETWPEGPDPLHIACLLCESSLKEECNQNKTSNAEPTIHSRGIYSSPASIPGPQNASFSYEGDKEKEDDTQAPIIPRLRGGGHYSPPANAGARKRVRFYDLPFLPVPSPTLVGSYRDPLTYKRSDTSVLIDPKTRPTFEPIGDDVQLVDFNTRAYKIYDAPPSPPSSVIYHDQAGDNNHAHPTPLQPTSWQGPNLTFPYSIADVTARASTESLDTQTYMTLKEQLIQKGIYRPKDLRQVGIHNHDAQEGLHGTGDGCTLPAEGDAVWRAISETGKEKWVPTTEAGSSNLMEKNKLTRQKMDFEEYDDMVRRKYNEKSNGIHIR